MNLFKRKPKEETVSKTAYDSANERIVLLEQDKRALDNLAARFRQQRDEANIERLVLRDRLERIAAQATPGANATVKRMAAIARGEEPQSRDKQQAEVGA